MYGGTRGYLSLIIEAANALIKHACLLAVRTHIVWNVDGCVFQQQGLDHVGMGILDSHDESRVSILRATHAVCSEGAGTSVQG